MKLNLVRRIAIRAMAIIVIIFFLKLWLSWHSPSNQAIHRTRVDIENLASAVRKFAIVRPSEMCSLLQTNFNQKTLYDIISEPIAGVSLVENRDNWKHAGLFLDRWGYPIHAQVISTIVNSTNNIYKLKLWSVGPDGIDNHGDYDDLGADEFYLILPNTNLEVNSTRQPMQ